MALSLLKKNGTIDFPSFHATAIPSEVVDGHRIEILFTSQVRKGSSLHFIATQPTIEVFGVAGGSTRCRLV